MLTLITQLWILNKIYFNNFWDILSNNFFHFFLKYFIRFFWMMFGKDKYKYCDENKKDTNSDITSNWFTS